jgi:UDP-N-acetylmuramoyl-tripeptide--D-alanyl-D-alanine ligase
MQGLFNFMETRILYNIYLSYPNICIDSRKLTKDCIFFSLKGENFDGNQFAQKALLEGAAYAIVDNAEMVVSDKTIFVRDCLSALQELAEMHRKHLNIPVLAITGSNGKTTTKELCRDVLASKFKVKATFGNLNNHIGVPLTILETRNDIEFLILEMGANHQGEIGFLCKIGQPDHVMITNIGKAHMEGFGGIEGIKKGKSEMYRYIDRNGGKIFINNDDSVLISLLPSNAKLINYSEQELVKIVNDERFISFEFNGSIVQTRLYGKYNIPNIAFAIALGSHFGVSENGIINALSNYEPDNNRSQVIKIGNNTYIKDAYNANPSSMLLSLESFGKSSQNDKIIVLGDMLELGEYADYEHNAIVEITQNIELKSRIFIGKHFYECRHKFDDHFFKTTEDAKEFFVNSNFQNCLVLLKGSRGIAVEQIIP